MEQIVGNLGYFGQRIQDQEYNKRVTEANILVDEYNNTVGQILPEKQMEYQKEVLDRLNTLIGFQTVLITNHS